MPSWSCSLRRRPRQPTRIGFLAPTASAPLGGSGRCSLPKRSSRCTSFGTTVGPPGMGKTTVLREFARVLSDLHGRRLVVVDTSVEIGGADPVLGFRLAAMLRRFAAAGSVPLEMVECDALLR